MIEETLLEYLNGILSVPVYMEKPEEDIPDQYVLLEKTGSGKDNHISSATFAIQSYAPSLYEAAALSHDICTAMEQAVSVKNISRSSLNSEYNYTDTTKKQYRYQAVFDVVYIDL